MKLLSAFAAAAVLATTASASAYPASSYELETILVNGRSTAEVQAKLQAKIAEINSFNYVSRAAAERGPKFNGGAFSCDKAMVSTVKMTDKSNTLIMNADGTWTTAGVVGQITVKCFNY